MKRSRENKDDSARGGTKKPKSIQACTSCRKHKTRCEILDPSKSPVRCHRCQVLTLQCSYEETILPTASTSKLPTPTENAEVPKGPLNAMVAYPSTLPPTDRIWSFVAEDHTGIDWSAPMLAIQQLSKLPFAHILQTEPAPVLPPGELSLPIILSDEQKRHLLDLFDERYTPWLNFKPSRSTSSSLLDIVCCAIASRHLDNALVKLQLQKLTEDSIAKMIFNPRPSESVEAIQALLILSLWTPLGGPPENEGRDGRLLIASAVSMAMNLRLNQASLKANTLKKRGRLSVEDTEALEEMVENARLWIALTNTESLLCTGTGRVPLSRRSPEDLALVEYPKEFDQQVNYGDLRLGLTASHFDLVEEGVSNRLLPGKDVDGWYDGIMIVLEKMKRVKRLMMPLPYVLDHDQFYFHILNVYQDMARLLVLYHALYDARVSVGHVPFGESWHPYFKPHGTEAVGEWGRDMVLATESLLVNFLAADANLLASCPDIVFTMVALAAGHLVGVKFLMFRGGSHLLGSSDLLLARIVALLTSVSCAPGHAPQRTAFLIKGMVAKWEGRFKKPAPIASYPTPTSDHDRPADNSAGMSRTPSNADLVDPSAFAAIQPGTLPPFDIDLNMFMDATPFDADFWNDLAQQTRLLPGYE
ncbi:hypothetical protein DFH08DRAFT_748674 [Mycena albidolilacea]|uniref:Zn(2)-C6 fungal-type domain-containing protein n=1 Tax=Mycena albidolilacea TaxID=1033008 RepID=A0AAD6ZSM1_9AGAR|nr:hypothetical protein DFH08DRAFT_748674 [Mycena albidolilacea]